MQFGTCFATERVVSSNRPVTDVLGLQIETLDADECRRLLAAGGVGRLAVRGGEGDAPKLRPVNFVLKADQLVVRTGHGTILSAARRGDPASFEIDGIDPLEHTGWSVVVVGKLSELPTDDAHLALPLRPWASGQKDRFAGLSLERVSGMRIPSGRGNR